MGCLRLPGPPHPPRPSIPPDPRPQPPAPCTSIRPFPGPPALNPLPPHPRRPRSPALPSSLVPVPRPPAPDPRPPAALTRSPLRCLDIMELWERQELLRFHWHTLKLYCAVCALGNTRVAHALCSHVDPAQLLFAIRSAELPGPLRAGFYELLLAVHLEQGVRARASMSAEFIVPMDDASKRVSLFPPGAADARVPGPPGVGLSACLRPRPRFAEPCFVRPLDGRALLGPAVPLRALGRRAIRMLREAVAGGGPHARDPVGGSVEFQLVPVLKLVSALLAVGALRDAEVRKVLRMIEPRVFGGGGEEEDEGDEEGGPEEGLLQMKLPESVKLQVLQCWGAAPHRPHGGLVFSP